jgi:accessory colonization factor AcfC
MSTEYNPIIFKNELGKEVKINFEESDMRGLKGAKNVDVIYTGVKVSLSSVERNINFELSNKELNTLRLQISKYIKITGKTSEVTIV